MLLSVFQIVAQVQARVIIRCFTQSCLHQSTFLNESQQLQKHFTRICLECDFGDFGDWNLIDDLHVDWNDNFGNFLAVGCGWRQNYLWSIVFTAVDDWTLRWLWNQSSRFWLRNLNDVIFFLDGRNDLTVFEKRRLAAFGENVFRLPASSLTFFNEALVERRFSILFEKNNFEALSSKKLFLETIFVYLGSPPSFG